MSDVEQAPEPRRIKFGASPTQEVPPEWADRMLTWLRDTHPQVFIAALAQGADASLELAAPSRRRGKPAEQ